MKAKLEIEGTLEEIRDFIAIRAIPPRVEEGGTGGQTPPRIHPPVSLKIDVNEQMAKQIEKTALGQICARCGKPIPPGPGYSLIRTNGKREHKRCDKYADDLRSEKGKGVSQDVHGGELTARHEKQLAPSDTARNSEGKVPLGYYQKPLGRKDVKQCDACARWFKEKYLTGKEGGGRICLRCESMPKTKPAPGRIEKGIDYGNALSKEERELRKRMGASV